MSNYDKAKAAQVMFDFVTSIKEANDVDAIMREISIAARYFGLDCFAISGLPLPGEKIDPYFLLSGWPEEWFKRYLTENHVHADPVIYQTMTSDEPFVWSETLEHRRLSRLSKRVMDEATEFKMRDGFSVPLHLPGGFQAIVTYGAERVDLSQEARAILHIISIYAHNQLRSISKNETNTNKNSTPYITAAEREVIYWAAEGKTNWEIGKILGRSARTVQHELCSAQQKLSCVNRGQVIAEALRLGIIR